MSEPPEDTHKVAVRVLVVLASFFAFLSILTTWIDRQALDTDQWVHTSSRLIEDKTISDAVANYAIEQVYASVNVQEELKSKLPSDLKPLAGPAQAGLRQAAIKVAQDALQRPRFQDLWREANRAAHQQFVAILEDKSDAVSTTGGHVVLDLRPIVEQLADQIGISKDIVTKIPPDVAQLEVANSDELSQAQTVVKVIQGSAILFSIVTLLLFVLAVYLAPGRRWVVIFSYGIGLIIAGVAALALRKVGSQIGVESLAKTESVKPAVEHAFAIGTDLLRSIAKSVILIGVFFVVASFLASPSNAAMRLRRAMAPTFVERPAVVWGVFTGFVLIFLIVSPPHGSSELLWVVGLIAIAGIGIEALSRKIQHECPDAKRGDTMERMRERMRELAAEGGKKARSAMTDIGEMIDRDEHEDDQRLARLEKIGELRDKGILTEEEFTAEKRRLLESGTGAP